MVQPSRISPRIDLGKVNMDLVLRTSKSLRELKRQLWSLFPERDDFIRQLVYGVLMREHVLAYGTYGTAKSLLATTFFGAFMDHPYPPRNRSA